VLYAQGGTHRAHGQIALQRALVALTQAGLDQGSFRQTIETNFR
jgi:hypothetical protein